MPRNVLTLLVTMVITAPLMAQQQPPPPQRMRIPTEKVQPISPTTQKAEQPKPVPVDQKLRYILKQLNLNDKQKQHAEGLFAILQSESNLSPEETKDRMDQIMSTYRAMQDAEKAGDKARADQLREELKNLAPGAAAERNFVNGMLPVLDDQQKAKFQELLKKLDKATDLSLKPVEIIRIAREQKLTPEQSQQLDQIQAKFRETINAAGGSPDAQAIDKLVADVSGILDATQRPAFHQQIAARRADEAPAKPTTQPAGKP